MTLQNVGIVFGGANSEHEVSCSSARGVLEHLDRERFAPVLIGIDKTGGWHRVDAIDDLQNARGGATLPRFDDVDVILPLLHGRFGEDGTVQGLFELAGVPYVGNGVLASALAMDKQMCQRVLAAAGIPTVPTVVVTADGRADAGAKAESIGYPIFVKPNRAGSSVGVSRVESAEGLGVAIDLALASDTTALLQPLVVGDEVDLGVLQATNGDVAVGAALRILPGEGSTFFDYASKYTDGGHEFEVPALLDDELRGRLESLAVAAFRALDCEGLARVDFFVTSDGSVILNEVNTMPGMTSLSQYPAMWKARGIEYTELLTRLIDRALVARVRIAR